jgi:hypothetical protein
MRGYGVRTPICVVPNGVDGSPTWVPDSMGGQDRATLGAALLGRIHPKKARPAAPGLARGDDSRAERPWHRHRRLGLRGTSRSDGSGCGADAAHRAGHVLPPLYGRDKAAAFRGRTPSFFHREARTSMTVLEAWAAAGP